MPSPRTWIVLLSSLTLRATSFFFLRWIPSPHVASIVFASALVYCISFVGKFLSTSPYEVVLDEVDILTLPLPNSPVHSAVVDDSAIDVIPVERIDIQETVILEEKPPHVLETLLSGIPSPSSLLWSSVTFLTNLALVAMVTDMTYRTALFWPAHDLSFARLGYVSCNSARLLVREPDVSKLPIFLSYRYADPPTEKKTYDSAWKHAGTIKWLSDETDFTAAMEINDLMPDTRYQYAFSTNHSGYIITAPTIGQVSSRAEFNGKFTFLHSSCILPRLPYSPLQHPLHVAGFKKLSRWLGVLKPAFMLFLGDFIYVDVPRRHGVSVESYRREYRQIYSSPEWPLAASTKYSVSGSNSPYDVPWIHVYDDHEINNDWNANTTTVFPAAFDPYLYYHLSLDPPLFLSASATPHDLVNDVTLPSWMVFDQGPASFFILDTRRYRNVANPKNHSDPTSSILGQTQLFSLLRWLSSPPPKGVHWKFVVSSVPFTTNWQGPGTLDTWTAYVHERNTILKAMWKASADLAVGIVVLSGDRHEFAATAFPPPEGSGLPEHASVHEFSCSPLNMFYLPIRTYKQDDPDDVCIKYIPDGNSKFCSVSIDKETKSGQSLLSYRVFIDGDEAWSHILTAGETSRYTTRQGQGAGLQRASSSSKLTHLSHIIGEGRNKVQKEGSELVEQGDELVGRREEVAAQHVEDAKHKEEGQGEEMTQSLDNLASKGNRQSVLGGSWVGRRDRWKAGWGENV